jgi:hypothetical protein
MFVKYPRSFSTGVCSMSQYHQDITESCPSASSLFDQLQQFVTRPVPTDAEAFWQLEQEVHQSAAQLGDLVTLQILEHTHQDTTFVETAVTSAREKRSVPLRHKGWKPVSILLRGGTKVILKTPYLRTNWKKVTGRRRRKRGPQGSGCYPVLEALGILERVSPATRSEIALYTVQAATYQEAVDMLARQGIQCRGATVGRIALSTAQTDVSLRDAALQAALDQPIPHDGPLAGLRVRIGVDGGRVRTRKNKPGRKTKNKRHRFHTPWKEPRVLVIDILQEDGSYDALRLPLYDVLIDDGDAVFAVVIGYLRLLGAAFAETIEFIADGADWMWERVDHMIEAAELPATRVSLVLDFYHAAEHLAAAVALFKDHLCASKRQKLFTRLRHTLRHTVDGVTKVLTRLKALGKTYQVPDLDKALGYFEKHVTHMAYATLDAMNLPVGSGQVESAVRRVINLRFKAPGTFWNETTAEHLMHLRACFKTGRWEELIRRFIRGKFIVPSFEVG